MPQSDRAIPLAPMLNDILGQVDSIRDVLRLHTTGSTAVAECAAALQRSSGRVILSGMGASYFAAMPAASVLEEGGRPVLLAESSELLHYGSGQLRAGDIAVLISRSGGSVEVLRLAEQMRSAGVRVIGVTNVPDSPLTALAEHTLVIGSRADQLIAVQTYTGTVLTLLLLAEQTVSGSLSSLAHAAEAALAALQQLIDASLVASAGWEEFLLRSKPLYLLARGPARATAHAAALLFHETAKASAVPISSGQFRHGPVEVIDANFRAVVIGTPSETRELDWKLTSDLLRMGGQVLWLGPPMETDALPVMVEWPADLPPRLLPLFEVVPFQIAAYRLAWWRGLTPGDFRYASEITGSETGFPLFEKGR